MDTIGNRVAARGARGVATRVQTVDASVTPVGIPVAASRLINVGDNGATLIPAGTLTLTIPDGLPDGMSFAVAAVAGTTSIARQTTALLNGAATTLTRLFSTSGNTQFNVKKTSGAPTTPETYIVTGS